MIVTCDEKRWEWVGKLMRHALGPDAQPCGKTYDDAKRSTICPHRSLAGDDICPQTDLFQSVCPHCKKEKVK